MGLLVEGRKAGEGARLCHSLSRKGTEKNLACLWETHGDAFRLMEGDIRDARRGEGAVESIEIIYSPRRAGSRHQLRL